jgi:hypothetical protein
MKFDGKKLTLSWGHDGLPWLPICFSHPIFNKFN